MVKTIAQRKPNERGQAVVLTILSLSIFVFAAMGLAIDGAQLYAQRQMAQAAADAAAQAGIVTIFNGSSVIGTAAYYCTATSTTSPCTYAVNNLYTAGTCTSPADAAPGADCIKVDPNPGVTVSNLDPGTPNELQVTVTRAVPMTLMKLAGFTSLNVTARATAAILDIPSPVPILVTHPWKSGSLSLSGNPTIQICGGPQRSIQVNSSSSMGAQAGGSSLIDLSKAGPNDSGACTTGTGADFGDFGGPSSLSAVMLGTTGHYIQPADPIRDPLASVTPPSRPAAAAPSKTPLANGVSGCPASSKKGCNLYYPGLYTSNLDVKNETGVFAPGIYYLDGANLSNSANGDMVMATGLTDASTGWTGNVLFYLTGTTTTSVSGCSPAVPAAQTGSLSVGANGSASLIGSPNSSSYKGILFFVDRSAVTQTHSLGGGGTMTLVGTIYLTDTVAQMGLTGPAPCGQFQTLALQGGSGSSTLIQGEIIVSMLTNGGNPNITMDLNPNALILVRQIALVNGE